MPQYAALTYTADVDWTAPEHAAEMAEYSEFGAAHGEAIRGGAALYPTATATTVRVQGARGGEVRPPRAPAPASGAARSAPRCGRGRRSDRCR